MSPGLSRQIAHVFTDKRPKALNEQDSSWIDILYCKMVFRKLPSRFIEGPDNF